VLSVRVLAASLSSSVLLGHTFVAASRVMSDNLSLSDFSESDIRQLTISTWLYASAACLLFFDYIVTLPREVEVIWKGRFSLPAFLYYLIRYLPLVWASLSLSTNTASAGPTDTVSIPPFSLSGLLNYRSLFRGSSSHVPSDGLLIVPGIAVQVLSGYCSLYLT